MIYLIESGNFYKIGFTENLKSRMKQYATHNPDYRLIDNFDGDKEDEKELHELCKEFHHSLEWFNKDERVLEIFQEYKNSNMNIYNKKIKDLKFILEKLKNNCKYLYEISNKHESILYQILDINKEILAELRRINSLQERYDINIIDLKSRLNYLEYQFQED